MRMRLASFCIALAAALLRQADVPTPVTRGYVPREIERKMLRTERERERERDSTDKQKLWSTVLQTSKSFGLLGYTGSEPLVAVDGLADLSAC
jgi:hypothetical protein